MGRAAYCAYYTIGYFNSNTIKAHVIASDPLCGERGNPLSKPRIASPRLVFRFRRLCLNPPISVKELAMTHML